MDCLDATVIRNQPEGPDGCVLTFTTPSKNRRPVPGQDGRLVLPALAALDVPTTHLFVHDLFDSSHHGSPLPFAPVS